ncbi:integrin beta 2-like, isoform CRA_a [Mus musculus]|nr:integrin beta 2-like, isoform CRA_a [Mus musculus]
MLGQCTLLPVLAGLLSLESALSQLCTKDNVSTCQDCIRSGPSCAWCQKLNFTGRGEPDSVRCDTPEQLLLKGCTSEYLVDPKSLAESQEDKERDQRQLSPRNVTVFLRPGQAATFKVDFQRTQDNSVDLYFLMGLSGSAQGHLSNVQTLGSDLLKALNEISRYHTKLSLVLLQDKYLPGSPPYLGPSLLLPTTLPLQPHLPPSGFGSIVNMTFQHILKLTADSSQFQRELRKQLVSGKLATPKGQLDAVVQVAICLGEIGWRNGTRFLVLVTDNDFHLAKDKTLGTRQNTSDGRCHLDDGMYRSRGEPDYQSVVQLASKLAENNIQPIFVVPSRMVKTYEKLTTFIPKLTIGELSDDSSNVAQLIRNAYSKLSSIVVLNHSTIPSILKVTYDSYCSNGTSNPGKPSGDCSGVQINDQVTFQVNITASECFREQFFFIQALGFMDSVTVRVLPLCECQCQEQSQHHSLCGGKGAMECGICRCNSGYAGKNCECQTQGPSSQDLEGSCRKDNSSIMCSGLGDCICGQCECHTSDIPNKEIYGQYCECDNVNCERYDGQVCGGPERGHCSCGRCFCRYSFVGSACQCRMSTSGCLNNRMVECSGHGRCYCNRCLCDPGYQPPLCEKRPGYFHRCSEYYSCARCLKDNSAIKCRECWNLLFSNTPFSNKTCMTERDSEGCWTTYTLYQPDQSDINSIYIKESLVCAEISNTTILLGVIVGVLLAVIFLLVYCMVYLKGTQKAAKLPRKGGAQSTLAQQPHFQEPHHVEPVWNQERQGTQ